MASARTVPRLPIALLGLVTIVAYGSWYYAFGVLLDPIIADTGWAEGSLATAFSVSIVLTGAGSIGGGLALDRLGSRPVFLFAGLAGGGLFWLASAASSIAGFAAPAAAAGGTFGALGFYHITQATAVRIVPADTARAIAHLTIYGAFASVVFLPLAAGLVEAFGWRPALRVMAALAAGVFIVAALLLPATRPSLHDTRRMSAKQAVRRALRRPAVWLFMLATAMTGIATSVILVYQVPVMTAAGLSLSVAATVAAIRGFAQLTGRIPIAPIVRRLGARRSLVAANLAIGGGTLLLLGSGSLTVALGFALVVGAGIGAMSPLQGIYADELFDREGLGTLMGMMALLFAGFGALGPILAGYLAESTGTRSWSVAVVGVAAATACVALIFEPDR